MNFRKFLAREEEDLVSLQVYISRDLKEEAQRVLSEEPKRLTWKELIEAFLKGYIEEANKKEDR